ncbi:hypothetical protein ACFFRR_002680 [Megaselia abdita]
MKLNPRNRKIMLYSLLILALLASAGIGVGLCFAFHPDRASSSYSYGAITSNAEGCADLGRDIIKEGGSAADAAITLLLCEGVMLPQSSGIGGGFMATIKHGNEVMTLTAREWAPLASTEDMFVNISSVVGGIAVGVPGELLGYHELHNKYGRLKWKRLFEPVIKLCREGHKVIKILASVLEEHKDLIKGEESLKDFVNPITKEVWKENDTMKRLKLADTLEVIADKGAMEFYEGDIGKQVVKDVHDKGGILTEKDLKEYRANWSAPTNITFLKDYKVYSIPTPGSGAVLSMILNLMENSHRSDDDKFWHRAIESFKHAYGQRTNLGDMTFEPSVQEVYNNMLSKDFAKEIEKLIDPSKTFQNYSYYGATFADTVSYGTISLSVLHPDGDAVAVTSTINTNFGAKFASKSTGIIMNDQMDDFSTPGIKNAYGFDPSPANFVKPKKRPQSSMCPTIIVNKKGEVEFMVGGAGGSKITTSVASAILRYFLLNESAYDAVGKKRLHHQLAPHEVQYETGYSQSILDSLSQKQHRLKEMDLTDGFNAVTVIGTRKQVTPVFDPRRGGSATVVKLKKCPL